MKVAIIAYLQTPLFKLVFLQNLDYLKRHKGIEYTIITLPDLPPPDDLKLFDAVIFMRHTNVQIATYHALLVKLRIKTIYYLDDYLVDIPTISTVSNDSDNYTLPVYMAMELADRIIVSTKELNEAFGYQEKTTVIPATFPRDEYLVPNYIVNERLTSFEKNPLRLVIVQSDALYLTKVETENLIQALETISKRRRLQLNLFGNIDIQVNSQNVTVVRYPFMDICELQKVLCNSSFHIALVPLANNFRNKSEEIFALCKNKIKFINFGLAGIPGVYSLQYSKKMTYPHIIYSDNTVEGWVNGISKLMNSRQLYESDACISRKIVEEEYDISVSAEKFFMVLNELCKKTVETQLIMPRLRVQREILTRTKLRKFVYSIFKRMLKLLKWIQH